MYLIEMGLLNVLFNSFFGKWQFLLLKNDALSFWQQLFLEFCVGIIAGTLGSLAVPIFRNKVLAFVIIIIVADNAQNWLNFFTNRAHGKSIIMILTILSMISLIILYDWINQQSDINSVKTISQ
ncbi:MAG: hypothetical protein J6584_06495 [Lactobacillus sp.]|uniref:hypothetical protein n=1 Tax=Bombilactobacillus bombi TaxID=1303590 RepID=UPI0035E5643A|nr:hypothetical protein [Lactobacillus sp.]